MAYASHSTPALKADLAASGRGLIARFSAALERRRVYYRTARELNNLTTRELADLGLSRSMITRVALEAAYGK